MSSAKKMLIDEFNREFDALNKYFIDEVFPTIGLDIKADFFDDYDIEKINYLFGGYQERFKNEDDLLEALTLLLDKGYSTMMTHKKHGLFYIPMFVYFLKHNPVRSAEFYELCMRIHLSKDKERLFSSERLRELQVPFRARMADTLEMVLLAPNFSTDLRTVFQLLDYIDYERFINGENDSEYSKYLQKAEKELFAYVCFLASDSLLEEYYKNREGNTRSYQYSKYRFTKAVVNLMSYYIDTKTPEYKNKFLEFKVLEERLKSATDIDDRKNNMMVAFTYRQFPSNDFYDSFSDIGLTMNDLVVFINRYEEYGNSLLPRQLDNLLVSFRKRYLEVNGLTEEFNKLSRTVQETYDEYRKTRYAFLPNEFIRYYNIKYPDSNFRSFNFGKSSVLTRDIYELIINGNNLIGFDDLIGSRSYGEYVSDRKIKVSTSSDDIDQCERDSAIYNKYYDMLSEWLFTNEYTVDYMIRRNVSEEDLEDFMKLKSWFDKYSGETWDYSYRVLERTFIQLQADFDKELRNSPFKDRLEILYKYNEYVVCDQIKGLVRPRFFYSPMHEFEKEFISQNGIAMFETVMSAYNNGDNLLPVLDVLGLAVEDINLVFGSLGKDFAIKAAALQRKASEETQHLEAVRVSEKKQISRQAALDLLNKFLQDKQAYSINEFCFNNGISMGLFDNARDLVKEEEALQQAYDAKIAELRACRNGSRGERIRSIYDGFVNGVRRADGTVRPFNYLDYRLMTDMPVRKFVKIACGEFGDWPALKEFGRLHHELFKYNEESVLSEKYIIMVDGKPHEVTTEEKQAALNFIDQMELPHEAKLYSLVIRASLNGDLDLGQKDDGVKVFVKEDRSVSN